MGYRNIVVEGDSTLIINRMKKMNLKTKWDKLSHRWTTKRQIQEIGYLIHNFDYIMTSHVRREGNRVVDFLANSGCSHENEPLEKIWSIQPKDEWLQPLEEILEQD